MLKIMSIPPGTQPKPKDKPELTFQPVFRGCQTGLGVLPRTRRSYLSRALGRTAETGIQTRQGELYGNGR